MGNSVRDRGRWSAVGTALCSSTPFLYNLCITHSLLVHVVRCPFLASAQMGGAHPFSLPVGREGGVKPRRWQ